MIRSGYALSADRQRIAVDSVTARRRRGFNSPCSAPAPFPEGLRTKTARHSADAEVEALSLRVVGSAPNAAGGRGVDATDDRGEFRLTGLPAGQYFIVARDPAFNNVGDESGALRYAPDVLSRARSRWRRRSL